MEASGGDNEVRIDLRDFGGGIIILEGVATLDAVRTAGAGEGEDMLHIYNEGNVVDGAEDADLFDTGDGGFIL